MDAPFEAVARVIKAHGLKGEVAVKPLMDLPLDYLIGTPVWFVPPPEGVTGRQLASVRSGPKGPLLAFTPALSTDEAHLVAGRTVLVRTDALPDDIPEEELDPVGLRVVDEERGPLGVIEEVIVTGANDVWIVHGPLGEVLIPVIDDVVIGVDESAGLVTVRLLPGLIDED
jgi:16S rRNA processing protein RimM